MIDRLTGNLAAEGSNPDPNATFYLSPELSPEVQRILVKVTGSENYRQLTLWFDGYALTTLNVSPYEFWLPLETGGHRLFVSGFAADGELVSGPSTNFTVNSTSVDRGDHRDG